MSYDFGGKTVLITGGGSGIGRSTVFAFARAGAKVVLANRNEDEAMEALALIGGEKAGTFIKTDVSRLDDVQRAVRMVVETYGRLDVAFNNAGVQPKIAPLADITADDWKRVLSVDLTGLYHSMKAQIPIMVGQGGGVIVNMASTSGIRGAPSQGGYSAAKHGVIGLTKSAAFEYAKAGVRVNAVLPGPVDTPPVQQAIAVEPELGKMIEEMVPLGRSARPEEIADAVLFLASDKSNFIVGHSLVVDGGMTIK